MNNLLLEIKWSEKVCFEENQILDSILGKMNLNIRDYKDYQNFRVGNELRIEVLDWRDINKCLVNIVFTAKCIEPQKKINDLIFKSGAGNDYTIKILYQSNAITYLNNTREILVVFESILRAWFTEILIYEWRSSFLNNFNELLNHKEYISTSSSSSKYCKTYETINLDCIDDFAKFHWLGGNEYVRLSEIYSSIEDENEKITRIKTEIQKDIFADFNRVLRERFKKIKSIRNIYAHNTYADQEKIIMENEHITDINKQMLDKINFINTNSFINNTDSCDFLYISEQKIADAGRINLLEIVISLNMIPDMNSVIKNDKAKFVEYKYETSNLKIELRVLKNIENKDIFNININKSLSEINLDNFLAKKNALIIYDSKMISNSIKVQNMSAEIENLFRMYLGILQYSNEEVNIEKTKSILSDYSYKGLVEENVFYNVDFIDLIKIFQSLDYNESEKLKSKLQSAVNSSDHEKVKKIFGIVEGDYSRIIDLDYFWNELYKYRTKAVHLGDLSSEDLNEFKKIHERTREILLTMHDTLLNKNFVNLYKDPVIQIENILIETDNELINKLQIKTSDESYLNISDISHMEVTLLLDYINNNKNDAYSFSNSFIKELIIESNLDKLTFDDLMSKINQCPIKIKVITFEDGIQRLANEIDSILKRIDVS
jgi:hypothetical protein